MRDGKGGITGKMGRLERQHKAELALLPFTQATFIVNVTGDGRSVHLIEVKVMTCPASYVKDGWTLKDFKTQDAERFEADVKAAVEATQRKIDAVSVVWSSGALCEHFARMKGQQ